MLGCTLKTIYLRTYIDVNIFRALVWRTHFSICLSILDKPCIQRHRTTSDTIGFVTVRDASHLILYREMVVVYRENNVEHVTQVVGKMQNLLRKC